MASGSTDYGGSAWGGGADPQRELRNAVTWNALAALGPAWFDLAGDPDLPEPRDCDVRALWETVRDHVVSERDLYKLAARSPTGREREVIAAAFRMVLATTGDSRPQRKTDPAALARLGAVPMCRLGLLLLMERCGEK